MCYSEELKREAGGYFVDGEWVLTGWKGMYEQPGQLVWIHDRIEEVKTIQVMNKRTGFEWKTVSLPPEVRYEARQQKLGSRFVSSYDQNYVYEFGKVLVDDHGFHLAATKKGARKAVSSGVYTKILAKESAIQNNHAHVVMILAPGQEPTQDQIRAVALAKYDMTQADEEDGSGRSLQGGAVASTGTYGWQYINGYANTGSLMFTQPNYATSWTTTSGNYTPGYTISGGP